MPSVSSPISFTSSDCAAFGKYPPGFSWTAAESADQEIYRSVRVRLRELAEALCEMLPVSVPMASFVSTLNPNGRTPSDMWCCVFPRQVPNKSYALQFALIVSPGGLEVCCCLGAGSSQVNDPE